MTTAARDATWAEAKPKATDICLGGHFPVREPEGCSDLTNAFVVSRKPPAFTIYIQNRK